MVDLNKAFKNAVNSFYESGYAEANEGDNKREYVANEMYNELCEEYNGEEDLYDIIDRYISKKL